MKVFFMFLGFVASSVAQGVTSKEGPPRQVRIEMLVIQLPTKRALALQADLREPHRAKRGQQALLDLLEKDQAELIDWPIVWISSSNRAVAENISEIRYPSEFDPPRVIANPVSPDVAITLESKAPERSEITVENAKAKSSTNSPALLAGIPTTFETRNAGVWL